MVAALSVALLFTAQSWAGSIVDSTGATVESKDPQRVVTIAGNVSETVFALGMGDKVVAVDASDVSVAVTVLQYGV